MSDLAILCVLRGESVAAFPVDQPSTINHQPSPPMPLDPQAREFLDKLERSRAPQMHQLTPEEARGLVVPLRVPREADVTVANRAIEGPGGVLPIRIYTPQQGAAGPRPIVLYFHGGGWVVGSIASHDALCRRLCSRSGCIFISVDYRLAPEHKYPAAVEDAYAATAWASLATVLVETWRRSSV